MKARALLVVALLVLPMTAFAQVDEFPFTRAIIVNSPPEVKDWPITSGITSVRFAPNGWVTDFDKRLGSNAWPNIIFPPEFADPLQYTLGLCRKMTPSWMCSFVVEFWQKRIEEEGPHSASPPNEIAKEWFYDGRWGGLAGWQPQVGEQVGVVIMACDGRNRAAMPAGCIPQRTNARLVTWGADVGAPVVVVPPHTDPPNTDPPHTDPPHVDPPQSSGDIATLSAQVERMYADYVKREEERKQEEAEREKRILAAVNQPGWWHELKDNRLVIMLEGIVGGWLTNRYLVK